MKNLFKSFAKKNEGAITTEFLVLAAAAVGISIAGLASFQGSTTVEDADVNVTLERFTSGFAD